VPESGRANVVEVDQLTGVLGDAYRLRFRDRPHDETDRVMSGVARATHRGTLARFTTTKPDDVATPIGYTFEVSSSPYVIATPSRIEADLYAFSAMLDVPRILKDPAQEHEVATRMVDYEWSNPHVAEIENRIVIPAGYAMPPIVADERAPIGTMTLATTRRIDGNTLVVTWRLDTGKRRITAKSSPTRARRCSGSRRRPGSRSSSTMRSRSSRPLAS
jgi:hypothetical protein